jgi:RNA polymerase sigma-70 factor, ECF subfamily
VGYLIDIRTASMERQAVTAGPVTDSREDDSLVSAARDGDRAAFGRLYDRYARMVHGILLARVPPREVDDLVQEVFLSAMRKLHTLREISRFGAWLGTITRNRANDYFRKAIPDEKVTEPVSENQTETRSVTNTADQEATAILALVRALPEVYREPLILRLVEGMTGPEIAQRTGLTHGSVRVNLYRGMQMLREKMHEGAGAAGRSAV